MKSPKVSVIIAAHNEERTLARCLSAVLNQAYKDYEILVVDNNSTDKTSEIIKKFQKKDKKVRYVFEKRRGRGAARNAGIKEAKGEIIAMTDSDCIVPENWLSDITKPIIHEDEIAVTGSEKEAITNYWTKNIQKADIDFYNINASGDYISHVDTKNFAIKSSIIKKLEFDPTLKALEDFDFYFRLKKIGRVRFLKNLKVCHYHATSLKNFAKSSFERAYYAVKTFEKHKNDPAIKKEVMMQSISIKNFLLFPPWIIFQFAKRPFGEAYFLLVSEISWRIGIIYGWIKK